jgi:phage gp29-like protein
MSVPQLLGPDGRPIARKVMATELARPGLTGVRTAWSVESATAGLTPDRLAAILRAADVGDMDAFLTLAEEMEEKEPHYASVLSTRKLAVLGLPRQVTWPEGTEGAPKRQEIQTAVLGLVADPAFEGLLAGLLDAHGKGYAVVETLWDTGSAEWRPRAYLWRDPRWFEFDRETGLELRLREAGYVDGVPLQPFKYSVFCSTRKSGLPARAGLARLVAFNFVCKLYGLKDWLAYAEIFGIPLRLGKYDAAARPEDVEVLKRAVFGLGSDAAAVIPAAMTIDFPQLGQAAGGAELFRTLADWLDSQISKAVLGQTGTTDTSAGSGYAQSKVHNEVRGDLLKADARQLAAAVTQSVIAPFVLANFGPAAIVPSLHLVVEEPEDVAALANALGILVPLGLRVDASEVRGKLGLAEPAADAELLGKPAAATVDPGEDPEAVLTPAETRDALARRQDGGPLRAAARARQRQTELDALIEDAAGGWADAFAPDVEAALTVVRASTSFAEASAGLERLAADRTAPAAARALAQAMFAAGALGDASRRD